MTLKNPKFRVLMMPDYRPDNPYQTLLVCALEKQGVAVYFPWGYRRVLPMFRMAVEKKRDYDALHLHWMAPYLKGTTFLVKAFYSLKLLLDIFLTRWYGLKIIWTVHNQISHETPFPSLELWTRRALGQLTDRLILHHQSSVEAIAHDYRISPAKITVIPHGHYRDFYKPCIDSVVARKALNLPSSGLIYLTQGMIRPYKGIEKLLRVWAKHPTLSRKHILFIAGSSPDKEYELQIRQLASAVTGLRLELEYVEEETIPLLYSAVDIVVLPFERILTSGSLLLAMSYGKPIIAPKLGGIPEVLGEADVLLYDPSDANGLAQSLQKSTEIDLFHLGEVTSQVCDRFSWDIIAQKTDKVYES
jgi:beta-1,4-mannosyltransferase